MELKQLQLFVAVAEDLHFGRAAERMFIAQPALSQHIRRLERELGVELFDRRGRNVKLTDPGRAFLSEARRVVAQSERAASVAKRAGAGSEGVLTLGYYPAVAASAIPHIVQPYLDHKPGMTIHLVADGPQAINDALIRGDMDLAVTSGPIVRTGMVTKTVQSSQLAVVLPAHHDLATEDGPIDLGLLEDTPLVLAGRSADPELFDSIVGACHNAGFNARTAHVVKSPELVLPAVVCGLGLGIVPMTVVESWANGSIVARAVANGPATDVLLARRVDRSESTVLDFWDFVGEIIEEAGAANSASVQDEIASSITVDVRDHRRKAAGSSVAPIGQVRCA